MSLKMLFIGILVLFCGILIAYVEFVYPEFFFGWAGLGLAGPLAWGLFIILILLGIGLIRGSFSEEKIPPLASPTDIVVDERIDIEGKSYLEEEISHCKRYLDQDEKMLALIKGNVDGESEFNRLVLTNKQIIFYPRSKFQSAITLSYKQDPTVERKKGKFLTHLGEINFQIKGKNIKFKNILVEYIDEIIDIVSTMKFKHRQKTKLTT